MARPIRVAPAKEYYISPDGKDNWSGTLPEPNSEGTDGPMATIDQMQLIMRRRT